MGTACTSCCDPIAKKDTELDLSSRKIEFPEPKTTPNSAEAEIRRHESRDSAREDSKNQLSNRQNSPGQGEKGTHQNQSKLKPPSSQNAGSGSNNASAPQIAHRDSSHLDLLKEKGTLGADLSNIRSGYQNSKISDPVVQSNNYLNNPKVIPSLPESPVLHSVQTDKLVAPNRNEDHDNSSDMKSSVTNNALELAGVVTKDQKNYIVVMKADQSKNLSEDREYQKSRSDCKSIEQGIQDVNTPHGNAAYMLGLGQGGLMIPNRSGITVIDDTTSASRVSKTGNPQGYLFSQETANNKLDNSILKSRYDLANYPSGRTIDVPEEGKTKDILKILTAEQLTDIQTFTDKRYHKTLVHLYVS